MTFPYDGLPPERTWREAVAGRAPGEVDPQVPGRFRIGRTTRVGSGGSCFARRLSERLRRAGFAYLDVEPALPWLSAEDRAAWNYGVYSARYGDVFTSRVGLSRSRPKRGSRQLLSRLPSIRMC